MQTRTLTLSNEITADLSADIDAVVVEEEIMLSSSQQLQNPTSNLILTNTADLSADIDVVIVGDSFFSSRITPQTSMAAYNRSIAGGIGSDSTSARSHANTSINVNPDVSLNSVD
jgi:hypothetical protein